MEELRVEGVATNAALLSALLRRPELPEAAVTTTFVDDHLAELVPERVSAEPTAPTGEADGTVEGTVAPRR